MPTIEEKSWIGKIDISCANILDVAEDLQSLASSFNHTGNFTIGESLNLYAAYLRHSVKEIEKAAGISLENQLKVAQDLSAATLRAALAGAFSRAEDK